MPTKPAPPRGLLLGSLLLLLVGYGCGRVPGSPSDTETGDLRVVLKQKAPFEFPSSDYKVTISKGETSITDSVSVGVESTLTFKDISVGTWEVLLSFAKGCSFDPNVPPPENPKTAEVVPGDVVAEVVWDEIVCSPPI